LALLRILNILEDQNPEIAQSDRCWDGKANWKTHLRAIQVAKECEHEQRLQDFTEGRLHAITSASEKCANKKVVSFPGGGSEARPAQDKSHRCDSEKDL
jgi:hypothetical protein